MAFVFLIAVFFIDHYFAGVSNKQLSSFHLLRTSIVDIQSPSSSCQLPFRITPTDINFMHGHVFHPEVYRSQLMRLWYLTHRRPAKAKASLRIRAVSLEPSLFAHMKYGSRRRVQPKIRHLTPLGGCACGFEE